MRNIEFTRPWLQLTIVVCLVALLLGGCSGSDGEDGAPGVPGLGGVSKSSATALNMTITGVSINSPPVVTFSVTNQDGSPVTGLTNSDLYFTIAKLIPGVNGDPSAWQNYINLTSRQGSPYIRGNRENSGTLVDNLNGTYSYTFSTDITDTTQTCPESPDPCLDADDNELDTSYDASLIHRVAMQSRGSLPVASSVYTFIPGSGAVDSGREIVADPKCNECHNELEAHDARTDTRYCVMCHNPGSTAPVSDDGVTFGPGTVDFKVMIHKIHFGAELSAGNYAIKGFSSDPEEFNDVEFPQDIKNCTKCHDGTPNATNITAQGDNWKLHPNMQACGSCHDDVDFSKDGSGTPPVEVGGHSGGIMTDNATCISCHVTGPGPLAWRVENAHSVPLNVAATKFQYNIQQICGIDVDADPDCGGAAPTVTFTVSDPTGATTHGYGNLYDINDTATGPAPGQDPEFSTAGAGLNILSAWDSSDYNNDGGSGSRPARANSLSAITNAVDNGDGTFTITLAALPVASGSAGVAMEGHPKGESVVGSGTYDLSVPVRGAVAYFTVNGGTLVERRVAVDIETKCDKCHYNLSLHGANRADNAQLCVMCHNPRNTDVSQRPKTGGIPDVSLTVDGKREESIDMKRLIHGIHAASSDGHGFREQGLVIYGYGGSDNDYSDVRFPGILNDCTTCHNAGTYELDGVWAAPLQNGIQATTMESVPDATDAGTYTSGINDQADDLMTTPTAAVCSACHDGTSAKNHMQQNGARFSVPAIEVDPVVGGIDTSYETCAICHGPDRIADLNVVHGIE